jgi:hypothetical protein
MIPALAAALIPQIPVLIGDLIEIWKKSNPGVTLEEWLSALQDGPSFEERKRLAALRLGVPYTHPTVVQSGPRKATAQDIIDAWTTGHVPEWFSDFEKAAVRKLYPSA